MLKKSNRLSPGDHIMVATLATARVESVAKQSDDGALATVSYCDEDTSARLYLHHWTRDIWEIIGTSAADTASEKDCRRSAIAKRLEQAADRLAERSTRLDDKAETLYAMAQEIRGDR